MCNFSWTYCNFVSQSFFSMECWFDHLSYILCTSYLYLFFCIIPKSYISYFYFRCCILTCVEARANVSVTISSRILFMKSLVDFILSKSWDFKFYVFVLGKEAFFSMASNSMSTFDWGDTFIFLLLTLFNLFLNFLFWTINFLQFVFNTLICLFHFLLYFISSLFSLWSYSSRIFNYNLCSSSSLSFLNFFLTLNFLKKLRDWSSVTSLFDVYSWFSIIWTSTPCISSYVPSIWCTYSFSELNVEIFFLVLFGWFVNFTFASVVSEDSTSTIIGWLSTIGFFTFRALFILVNIFLVLRVSWELKTLSSFNDGISLSERETLLFFSLDEPSNF